MSEPVITFTVVVVLAVGALIWLFFTLVRTLETSIKQHAETVQTPGAAEASTVGTETEAEVEAEAEGATEAEAEAEVEAEGATEGATEADTEPAATNGENSTGSTVSTPPEKETP